MIAKGQRPLLLVALSARVMAESAARGGLRPVSLDLFGDADTRAASAHCVALPSRDRRLDEDALLAAARAWTGAELVYGGGIDTRPELLRRLMRGNRLLGNDPDTVSLVHDPAPFFALLDRLGIRHPDVVFSPPADTGPWLLKEAASEGGFGVRPCASGGGSVPPGAYFQRRLTGRAFSVLFLADRQSAALIGFNTLLTDSGNPDAPFVFAGAINRVELTRRQRELIADYAGRLTQALDLVGLNGIDFMLEGGQVRVLELNPRPTATLQLFDADRPGGWLSAHRAACRGEPVAHYPVSGPVRGFRVVFAGRPLALAEDLAWPPWCADRPCAASVIALGEPICTVTASGSSFETVEQLLAERAARVLRGMELPRSRSLESAI